MLKKIWFGLAFRELKLSSKSIASNFNSQVTAINVTCVLYQSLIATLRNHCWMYHLFIRMKKKGKTHTDTGDVIISSTGSATYRSTENYEYCVLVHSWLFVYISPYVSPWSIRISKASFVINCSIPTGILCAYHHRLWVWSIYQTNYRINVFINSGIWEN